MSTPGVIILAVVVLVFYLLAYMHGYGEGVSETEARWSEAVAKKEAHERSR